MPCERLPAREAATGTPSRAERAKAFGRRPNASLAYALQRAPLVTITPADRTPKRVLGLLACAATAACAGACTTPRVAELYPQLMEHAGREIGAVRFVEPAPFSPDTLQGFIETEPTRCRLLGILPFCFPGTRWGLQEHRVQPERVAQDVARLTAFYRQSGYFGSEVVPEVEAPADTAGRVAVVFHIHRGPAVLMDTLVVEGTEGILDPDSLQRQLPLQPGELFHLGRFVASGDTVAAALRARGHAYAEVLRNYEVSLAEGRASALLVAVPGPRVVVDSVIVRGLERLDRGTVMRQVRIEPGDLLRNARLREAQRNLYELELIQFGSVALAPDTLQLAPDDPTTATLLVQIGEAPEYVVEAMAGYGTFECFRTRAQWTDRSFFGGGRRFTAGSSLSRIGIADPTDWLGSDACSAAGDTFANALDYRLSGELRQPFFFTPRNQLVTTLYAERQSEPRLFRRTAQGGRFELTHRLRDREVLSGGVDAEHQVTEAIPALSCFAFLICRPEDIAALQTGRWRNSLSGHWVRDRGDRPLDPTAGYLLRGGAVWATPLILSDLDFLRMDADGAIYRTVRPGWVAAGFLRLGTFTNRLTFDARDPKPPEERFYTGGPNTVRGYHRNELGPGLWLFRGGDPPEAVDPRDQALRVQFIPTGGASIVVASAELRFPSPVLRDMLRLATFVDAGALGHEPLWRIEGDLRVTPGAGVRIRTPVGPVRVDVAYNPHAPTVGPLFVPDPETGGLVRVADRYQPAPRDFWQRLRLHVAVGQAF